MWIAQSGWALGDAKHCKHGFQDKIEIGLKRVEELNPSSDILMVGDNFYGAPRLVNELSGHILSHLKHTLSLTLFQRPFPPWAWALFTDTILMRR